jgi:hypothetical protein
MKRRYRYSARMEDSPARRYWRQAVDPTIKDALMHNLLRFVGYIRRTGGSGEALHRKEYGAQTLWAARHDVARAIQRFGDVEEAWLEVWAGATIVGIEVFNL